MVCLSQKNGFGVMTLSYLIINCFCSSPSSKKCFCQVKLVNRRFGRVTGHVPFMYAPFILLKSSTCLSSYYSVKKWVPFLIAFKLCHYVSSVFLAAFTSCKWLKMQKWKCLDKGNVYYYWINGKLLCKITLCFPHHQNSTFQFVC